MKKWKKTRRYKRKKKGTYSYKFTLFNVPVEERRKWLKMAHERNMTLGQFCTHCLKNVVIEEIERELNDLCSNNKK